MIITLITGEKVKVKETWEERKDCLIKASIYAFTKLSERGHVVEDGELKVKYAESVIRVNLNHIVSYEETNT